METLRRYLGGHPGANPGQLCVTELSSLVMRAGRAGGLAVRTEVRVDGHTGTRLVNGEMDCGWFCPTTRRFLIAWEFDGRDVGVGHIAGDAKRLGNAKKFAACGALLRVQVLYALRNNLTYWGRSQADRCRQLLGPEVEVISDEDLMAAGGIEGFVDRARTLAGLSPLMSTG